MSSDVAKAVALLGAPYVGLFFKKKGMTAFAVAHSTETVNRLVEAQQAGGMDAYICLNPCRPTCIRKPAIKDIVGLRYLLVDVDPIIDTLPAEPPPWKLDVLLGAMFGEVHKVFSGRGVQYWCGVYDDLGLAAFPESVNQLYRGIGKHIMYAASEFMVGTEWAIDATGFEISRVVRLPGTKNLRAGRTARFAVDGISGVPTDLGAGLSRFTQYAESDNEAPAELGDYSLKYLAPAMLPVNMGFITAGVPSGHHSRHGALYACARNLHELGVPVDVASHLLNKGAGACRPSLHRDDPNAVRNVLRQLWGAD